MSATTTEPSKSPILAGPEAAELLVRERLSGLVRERHQLREEQSTAGPLEQNRLAIVRAQHELGGILIARYRPGL